MKIEILTTIKFQKRTLGRGEVFTEPFPNAIKDDLNSEIMANRRNPKRKTLRIIEDPQPSIPETKPINEKSEEEKPASEPVAVESSEPSAPPLKKRVVKRKKAKNG